MHLRRAAFDGRLVRPFGTDVSDLRQDQVADDFAALPRRVHGVGTDNRRVTSAVAGKRGGCGNAEYRNTADIARNVGRHQRGRNRRSSSKNKQHHDMQRSATGCACHTGRR